MELTSGKALWSIICGHCVLPSDEVVGEELENSAANLIEGILPCNHWTEDDHTLWCSKTLLKEEQKDFVYKLGNMLDIPSEEAWKLFQLFLQHEYRGSISQLESTLSCEREEMSLVHQVFNFFLTDPLHLQSCLRHILSSDSTHPYYKLFKEFIRKILDPDLKLGSKLTSQLRKMNTKLSPPKTLSPHLPPKAAQTRLSYQLSALRHQLATLLVYHGSPDHPCSPETVQSLLQLAQGLGLGRDLCDGAASGTERDIFTGYFEAIDAFHCFLLTLVINADSDPGNNPLCKSEWVSKLSPLIHSLGSKPWHLPPILAWAILQGRKTAADAEASSDDVSKYSRLIQRAVKGKVFQYLGCSLQIAAFKTDELLLKIGSSIAYSLICIVGTCIDLEKVNLIRETQELATVCLVFEPSSHLFWAESGGGASILLPGALEVFPHDPAMLLNIAKSLASASKFSAGKVVELLSELENFTWPSGAADDTIVCVSGSQCVSRIDLFPLPGVSICKDSHGLILNPESLSSGRASPVLISWQISCNAWQIILSCIKLLQHSISTGALPDPWCQNLVILGLETVTAVFRSESSIQVLPLFKEIRTVAQMLLVSASQITKPEPSLISALLKFFGEASKSNPSSFWSDLEGCPLLPSLPVLNLDKGIPDLLSNYRTGTIRTLICGVGSNFGSFKLLQHLCSIVEIALDRNIKSNNVRGSVVFITKEVVPGILLWRCSDLSQKIDAIEATFSLLHRSLEGNVLDSPIQKLIAKELSNAKSGAGATLKSVLESSANLHVTLDQPAEWPHSSHARKLTKLAQLALSLAHRLVGEYLTSEEAIRHFFFEGTSSNAHAPAGVRRDVWIAPQSPHLALTIAQFAYNRLNPRLPYLALRTLIRLAKEIAVPLVACLGSEAEGLRDCLLSRLDSVTEDMLVKVALLRLLSLSTTHQPGLIRLFLTPPEPLLESVVSLIVAHEQCKNEIESDLMAALVELVSSLFEKRVTTATSLLKGKKELLENLFWCLEADKPGEISNSIIGSILKILSLWYYDCENGNDSVEIRSAFKTFLNPHSEKFSSWLKYIYGSHIEKKINSMEDDVPAENSESNANDLLENCSQFLNVVLFKSPSLFSDDQIKLMGTCIIESILNLLRCDVQDRNGILIILSEIHLSLLHHCGRTIVEDSTYRSHLERLLGVLQSCVMQTSTSCQVLILSAVLKVFTSHVSSSSVHELGSLLANSCFSLVQQHCSLSSVKEKDAGCSPSTCLALSCAVLYQCMEPLNSSRVESCLDSSNLIPSLLEAAVRKTEVGDSLAVREIQRLFLLIIRRTRFSTGLTTSDLAESLSLALVSKRNVDLSILCDLLWCTTFCLKREGGSEGLEGAISLVAVHLTSLSSVLSSPGKNSEVALATVALVATLSSFHQMWRVIHPRCFEQMMVATATCVQFTTKMLHLKESLEREACGLSAERANNELSQNLASLSQPTIVLINRLLHILSLCLQSIRHLCPDLSELLCVVVNEAAPCPLDLIQPSIRRHSGEQETLPNLATLVDILDLYHSLMPKESRSSSGHSRTTAVVLSSSKIDVSLLSQCAEEALFLLLTCAASFILDPEVPPREARDVCTFVADETSSFFSHWFGRRSVSTPSPYPSMSPKSPVSDLPFFVLCRQIVTSLCSSNKA